MWLRKFNKPPLKYLNKLWEQAQPGELEVEYVYFYRLCVLFFINYEQGQGRQPFICLLLCLCLAFPAYSLLAL